MGSDSDLPIVEKGRVSTKDIYNTYNMGVGMSIVVAEKEVSKALDILKTRGEDAYVIGEIGKANEKIILE